MGAENVRGVIRDFFYNECGLDEDFSDSEKLFSSGMVNSLNVVQLVVHLEKSFGIKVSPLDMSFENFDSIELLDSFVSSKTK